jgi:hypothetical protein
MDTVFVPFEDIYPRDTWPVAPCARCGKPGTVKPDHPMLTVSLCEACIAELVRERE